MGRDTSHYVLPLHKLVAQSTKKLGGLMKTLTDAAITALRKRMQERVADIKADLKPWIARHSGQASEDPNNPHNKFPANYVEISSALLETAIDRHIWLHGPIDALEFIESAFRRQAEKFRRSLQ